MGRFTGGASDAPGTVPPQRPAAVERPVVLSEDLFRGGREIVIVHRDQEYRLRITSTGKLLLTK